MRTSPSGQCVRVWSYAYPARATARLPVCVGPIRSPATRPGCETGVLRYSKSGLTRGNRDSSVSGNCPHLSNHGARPDVGLFLFWLIYFSLGKHFSLRVLVPCDWTSKPSQTPGTMSRRGRRRANAVLRRLRRQPRYERRAVRPSYRFQPVKRRVQQKCNFATLPKG